MGPLARAWEPLHASAQHDVHGSTAQSHHGPLETWLLRSSFPKGHARSFTSQEHTSFLFGSSKKTSFESEVEKIKEVNEHSKEQFNLITENHAKTEDARKALDEAMAGRHAAMRPLCLEYMKHRAQLMGLAGAQCQAVQGRVNAEDLTVITGPRGCLAPDASGSSETEPGTPVVLHEQRCEHGIRKLLCSERLAELERGDPAPGEEMLKAQQPEKLEPGSEEHVHKHVQEAKEGEGASAGEKGDPEEPEDEPQHTDSMDQEFRKWCRPAFHLNVQPITQDLSRAVLAPTADAEMTADEKLD